jgi:hypothetical protein
MSKAKGWEARARMEALQVLVAQRVAQQEEQP